MVYSVENMAYVDKGFVNRNNYLRHCINKRIV